jgi:UDP-N-acetylglucosamine diphosphorylase / glucose-1-phosphate thymidylyltransferase / UDP-N-acetylgalactosamine diphosphorylase / glucosamine-1-phosphate N-acetyltransferase / galactosamine-1-phosphate N-acetyltransferase
MKAVILAAGSGQRVFPLAVNKPKPMFRLLGRPLMEYVVMELAAAEVREAVVVVGHNADQIVSYFGTESHGVEMSYVTQTEARGMADALLAAEELVDGQKFLVVNGDDVFNPGLVQKMLPVAINSDVVFASQPVEETWKFGILSLDGNRVTGIVEKPDEGQEPSNNAVIGVYMLSPDVFDYIRRVPPGDSQYEQAIQLMIEGRKDVRAVTYEDFFGSYKLPWDLLRLNEHFLATQETFIAESAEISEHAVVTGEHVYIGENVTILEHATVKGPCYVGPGAVIGNNALIRTFTSIGAGTVIGYGTEVKNSVIGANCWTHFSYIGDSVIGDGCSLGAGTITANLRFDEDNILVDVLGKGKMDSGTKKLGVIMADNCKTGSNATLTPGVKLGPHSMVGPGVLLYTDLEPNKIALQSKQVLEVRDNPVELDPEIHRELKANLLRYAKRTPSDGGQV